MPIEIWSMTQNVTSPAIYALGTLTTVVSFVVMGLTMLAIVRLRPRQSAGRVD